MRQVSKPCSTWGKRVPAERTGSETPATELCWRNRGKARAAGTRRAGECDLGGSGRQGQILEHLEVTI